MRTLLAVMAGLFFSEAAAAQYFDRPPIIIVIRENVLPVREIILPQVQYYQPQMPQFQPQLQAAAPQYYQPQRVQQYYQSQTTITPNRITPVRNVLGGQPIFARPQASFQQSVFSGSSRLDCPT